MVTATAASFQRAIDKATALGTFKTVRQVGPGQYRVSGSECEYAVTVDEDGEYACACPAGQRDVACYHGAGVWLRLKSFAMLDPRDRDEAYAAWTQRQQAARVDDPDTAVPSHKSGAGIGMGSRRWDDDDDTPYSELFRSRA